MIAVVSTSRSDFATISSLFSCARSDFLSKLKLIIFDLNPTEHQKILSELSALISETGIDVDILKISEDTPEELDPNSQVNTVSEMLVKFGEYLNKNPNISRLVLIGDRWELLGISYASFLNRIPIAHISGGEITSGAIDDVVRNILTKMSCMHICANDEFRDNIVQMGEESWRIKVTGELSLDKIYQHKFLSRKQLHNDHGLELPDKFLFVNFHVQTNDTALSSNEQIDILLNAINETGWKAVITNPGLEVGSQHFRSKIDQFSSENENIVVIESLGHSLFWSVMRLSCCVVGNSSSGLTEAPSVGVPTLNVGSRQEGRPFGPSVTNCDLNPKELEKQLAILKNRQSFTGKIFPNPFDPFEDGNNSKRAISFLESFLYDYNVDELLLKKFQQIGR